MLDFLFWQFAHLQKDSAIVGHVCIIWNHPVLIEKTKGFCAWRPNFIWFEDIVSHEELAETF